MGDYNLTAIGSRDFEHLTQALAIQAIGPGVTPFGDGPDGGREATYRGKTNYPSSADPWDGYVVLQSKFRTRPTGDAAKDGTWAIKQLRRDLAKFVDPKRNLPKPDYYVFVTNIVLTPMQNGGSKDRVTQELDQAKISVGLKGYAVWDYDKLCRLLDAYEGVRHAYTALITSGDVLSQMMQRRADQHTNPAQRYQRLEEAYRQSRARCIRRWQVVGLSRNEAIAFADNPIVCTTNIHTHLTEEHPLRVLIGEIGAGKSLIAERFFQQVVEHALQADDAPVPIYLSAKDAALQLRTVVLNAAESLGAPAIHGATIIIDGADEVDSVVARTILDEARELVNTWDHTTILITSRPLPNFGHATELITVKPLSDQQSHALIQRVAGPAFNQRMTFGWPQQLKEAVRRPLFAFLLANYLRTGEAHVDSIGGLLSALIEQALSNATINQLTANRLLQRLAVFCIDRGGEALVTEIATHHEIQPLLASGLVQREGK